MTTNLTSLDTSSDINVGGDLDVTGAITQDGVSSQIVKVAKVALIAGTGTSGGEVLAWANPEGATIIVHRLVLDITTQATGAANGDFGPAANATTSNDTLIDGVDIGTAAILADNYDESGTNGLTSIKLTSSQYITGTPSATAAGLVGNAYIYYALV